MLLFLIGIRYGDCQSIKVPKVVKEEMGDESKSRNYGDRVAYKITFADKISGKLWQAKQDDMWWGSTGMKDTGPFKKEEAIKWLWNYKHDQQKGAENFAAGAVVVGGAALSHGSNKTSTPAKSGTKKTSINLNKKQN